MDAEGGRTRYRGLCLHCLTETCVPMYRHQNEGNQHWSGAMGTPEHGIVWTCWFCGIDMFWYVEKTSFSPDRSHEWVTWTVRWLNTRLQAIYEWEGHRVPKHRGSWFQPVSTRTDTLSRFGEVWTDLKFGWNDGALPFSGELKTLPIGGP